MRILAFWPRRDVKKPLWRSPRATQGISCTQSRNPGKGLTPIPDTPILGSRCELVRQPGEGVGERC